MYETDGGDTVVVTAGGQIKIESGGKITNSSGAQASTISTVTATANTQTASYVQTDAQSVADLATANKTAINAIIAALKGAGIIASS